MPVADAFVLAEPLWTCWPGSRPLRPSWTGPSLVIVERGRLTGADAGPAELEAEHRDVGELRGDPAARRRRRTELPGELLERADERRRVGRDERSRRALRGDQRVRTSR